MLYLLVFATLLLLSVYELKYREMDRRVFNFMYVVITLMLVLRKGQGTDYYNYEMVYNEVGVLLQSSFIQAIMRVDPGYALLNIFAIKIGVGYKVLMAFFSLMTMILAWPFFSRCCRSSIVSLLIFFPLGYLIYFYSGARQGFAMAIILSAVPPMIKDGKKRNFFLSVIFAATFHISVIVCLIIPFIYKLRISNAMAMVIVLVFTAVSIVGVGTLTKILPPYLAMRMSEYEVSSNNRYLALMLRLIDILPIFLVSDKVYEKYLPLRAIRNIILAGFVIYSICSFSDITASRLNFYFRMFETLFFVLLVQYKPLKVTHIYAGIIYLFLATVLIYKSINTCIREGEYQCQSILEYPYFSVFTDDQTIDDIRLKKL